MLQTGVFESTEATIRRRVFPEEASGGTRVFVWFRKTVPLAVLALGGRVNHVYRFMPVASVTLPARALTPLAHDPETVYVEPVGVAQIASQAVPWGVERIGARRVWPGGHAGLGIKVAVLDTGIDPGHRDLGVFGGHSLLAYTRSWHDDHGHGTHVAGTIAALDNNVDVVGVAHRAQLYAVKVLDQGGAGGYDAVAAGIEWAMANGMQVINMSLGGASDSRALATACANAHQAGILLVAAAGNEGNDAGTGDSILYPAKYPGVVAVGSTGSDGRRSWFSSTGPALELMAPGESIPSTRRGGGTTVFSGTSMACPHVSGAATVVWSANPGLTGREVRAILGDTAEPVGTGDPNQYGKGMVDVVAAVRAAVQPQVTGNLGLRLVTNKTRYRLGETMYIYAVVTEGRDAPVAGAAVSLVVVAAAGSRRHVTGSTDARGQVLVRYWTTWLSGRGVYRITASAAKDGYTPAAAAAAVFVS
ncbi:MAG: S8 family peptidase [Bacillota bacterium]